MSLANVLTTIPVVAGSIWFMLVGAASHILQVLAVPGAPDAPQSRRYLIFYGYIKRLAMNK